MTISFTGTMAVAMISPWLLALVAVAGVVVGGALSKTSRRTKVGNLRELPRGVLNSSQRRLLKPANRRSSS